MIDFFVKNSFGGLGLPNSSSQSPKGAPWGAAIVKLSTGWSLQWKKTREIVVNTVGRNPAPIGSLSHVSTGFFTSQVISRISSIINSAMEKKCQVVFVHDSFFPSIPKLTPQGWHILQLYYWLLHVYYINIYIYVSIYVYVYLQYAIDVYICFVIFIIYIYIYIHHIYRPVTCDWNCVDGMRHVFWR